jgi:hypothetical protein
MRRTTIVITLATAALVATTAIRIFTGNGTGNGTGTKRSTPPVSNPAPHTESKAAVASKVVGVRVDANADPIPSTSIAPSLVESPVDAALRFLDLDEELFPHVTPEKARALTESIASDASRDRLGQQAFDHQTQIIAKGDLGGLTLRIAPIVFRTHGCTALVCTVDVFFLRLWSFPDNGALDDYATVEIHIVYEHDQWRLATSTLVDGPYPAGRFSARPTASLNAKAFETILSGYSDTETKR